MRQAHLIPSGAIGAIDALAAAALLPLDEVVHQIAKPPEAWKNTEAEKRLDPEPISGRQIVSAVSRARGRLSFHKMPTRRW
jgi:predicted dinucleotide-utilizing enzyme